VVHQVVGSVRKDVACFFGRLGSLQDFKAASPIPHERGHKQRILHILHNILHPFDELGGEVEASVHWAGIDGLHDPWVANPLANVTSVGLRGLNGGEDPTEAEASHDGFRQEAPRVLHIP